MSFIAPQLLFFVAVGPHGFGEHDVVASGVPPRAWHSVGVASEHVPSEAQHA